MTDPAPLAPELERWIAHFRGPLVGFLASRGASWRQAEELAMDTFAEAWLGRQRMRAGTDDLAAVGAYLRGIAHNLLLAWRRRRDDRHVQLGVALDLAPDPAAPVAIADERQDALRAAFPRLRPEHQEVLRMHYLEETGTREVAALLGVTRKTVEGRLYHARRALRALADNALRTAGATP